LIKLLARMGYAAKGSIYLLIGVTAILIAIGRRSQTPDFGGAIIQVFQQPFGKTLLALLTLGLIWIRFVVSGPSGDGYR